MRRTYSAGGVVLNNENKVLVVSQRGRAWSLPKGHLEKGERALVAAKREIKEESGVSDLEFVKELGTYERHKMTSENKDNLDELKVITILLFTTNNDKIAPEDPENPEARWVDIDDVANLLTHPKDKAFFTSVKSEVMSFVKLRNNCKCSLQYK
ncbi:MAG: NUDIX domain-containing protein [Nanoarchaeota archaeon]